jgi:DNA-binding transcriptional LysR family regulator
VLLCPKRHALAQKRSVKWSELSDVPLVRISERTANRRLIDDALGAAAEQYLWAAEVQHVASAIALAASGGALAIVPRLAVDTIRAPDLTVIALREPTVARAIGCLMRTGHILSPEALALLQDLTVQLRRRPK